MKDKLFTKDKRYILDVNEKIILENCDITYNENVEDIEDKNTNSNGEDKPVKDKREFIITKILGRGGSCIAYEVKYYKEGVILYGVLRQFNPLNTELKNKELEIYKKRFIKGYEFKCRFSAEFEEHKNISFNAEDFYVDEKNRYYILTTADNGCSYDKIDGDSIQDILKTALAVTKAVEVYHKNGYLHLDIKPQNVYVLNETREVIKLFDFDIINKKEYIEKYNGENLILPYSKGYSPSELRDESKYFEVSERTDIFSIGALVCMKIFGNVKEGAYYSIDRNDERFACLSPEIERLLNEFFRKTLTNVRRRYKNTSELKKDLEEMIEAANPENVFLDA